MTRRNAFTLIELLVVISVVALLLAIIVPALSKAKEMAKSIVCQNHVKTLVLAEELYTSQMDGKYVPFIDDTQILTAQQHWYVNNYFRKLVGFNRRKTKSHAPFNLAEKWVLPEEFWCPSDKQVRDDAYWQNATYENRISYGYNWTDWGPYSKQPYVWDAARIQICGHKADEAKVPGRKIMFTDAGDFRICKYGADYKRVWDKVGADIIRYRWQENIWDPVYYRHSEGCNIAFFDGHVEYLAKEKVFFYKSVNSDTPDDKKNNRMWFVNMGNIP